MSDLNETGKNLQTYNRNMIEEIQKLQDEIGLKIKQQDDNDKHRNWQVFYDELDSNIKNIDEAKVKSENSLGQWKVILDQSKSKPSNDTRKTNQIEKKVYMEKGFETFQEHIKEFLNIYTQFDTDLENQISQLKQKLSELPEIGNDQLITEFEKLEAQRNEIGKNDKELEEKKQECENLEKKLKELQNNNHLESSPA